MSFNMHRHGGSGGHGHGGFGGGHRHGSGPSFSGSSHHHHHSTPGLGLFSSPTKHRHGSHHHHHHGYSAADALVDSLLTPTVCVNPAPVYVARQPERVVVVDSAPTTYVTRTPTKPTVYIPPREVTEQELAITRIETRLNQLRHSRNPFLRSPQEKINVLEDLLNRIRQKSPYQSVAEIVNDWEHLGQGIRSNGDILRSRRNKFIGTLFYRASKAPISDSEMMINTLKHFQKAEAQPVPEYLNPPAPSAPPMK